MNFPTKSAVDGVGGYSLYRHCGLLLNNCMMTIHGTIGCFIQFKESQERWGDRSLDDQIYALTCQLVAKPAGCDHLASFRTSDNDELKEFSKEIGLHMSDSTVPVDIALLPLMESCDAFHFEHDECKVYDGEISKLKGKEVQKQGAATGLTKGEIISTDFACLIEGTLYDNMIMVASCSPDGVFSKPGDAGSLVTLCRNAGQEIHEAVSIVFAFGMQNFGNRNELVSLTLPLKDAMDFLLKKYNIDKDYDILSNLGSKALDKSGENSKNLKTAEDKIQSGTEALGGPAGGLSESKNEGIAFVKPSPNTNEIEEGSQSTSGDPAGLGESENERDASVEPSPNRSGFCEENSNNTVEENIQSETEAFGGPAGLGKSKNEVNCIREAKSQYTNKIEEGSQSASGYPAGLDESKNERAASMEQSTVSGTTVSADSAINSTSKEEDKLEDENKAAVAETLQHGGKKNNRISLLFIGQDGVGKTSLKKNLLGEEAEKYQASTIGIEYEVVEVKENNKSKPWKRAVDSQFIASKEYADNIIAKETAKRKHESQKNLEEAKDGSRRHDEDGRKSVKFGGGRTGSHENGSRRHDEDGRKSDKFGGGREGSDEGGRGYKDGGGEVQGNKFATAGGSHQDEREKNVKEKRKIKESVEGQIEYQLSVEQIEEAMKNVENYNDDTMDTIRFLVGDVGGQSVFYDVHSMMLRLRTLFTLVVDLTKSPNDVAQPKFVRKETKKEEDLGNPMQETNLDYLTKWAAALRNLNPCDNDAKTKNAVASPDQPKIIVVYTKADKLSVDEVNTKKEEVSRAVRKQLQRVRKCDELVVREFFINNINKPSTEESKVLEDLRASIFETAQDLLKNQEKTPVNWLVLERLLDKKKREATMRDHPYITFDEAQKLGKQCKLVDETFNDAMKFFHEENIVVHFQGESDRSLNHGGTHLDSPLQSITDLVVLDPAWLVKLFTEVITVSKISSWPPAQTNAWDDLREQGKLDFDKLPTVLDDHRGPRDVLIEMMVRAGLICHWRKNIYLVPSMVKEKMEKGSISQLLSTSLKPSLFLDFEDGSIPLGFYTQFEVELLKWANPRESKELELYCNFMRVAKTVNSVYSVILVRHISRIQFAISVHNDNSKTIEWTDIAREILSVLKGIIKRIQSNHPSFKGMRYIFGLKCDLCGEETDYHACQRHNAKPCINGDCVHIWSLDDLKEPLSFCPKNHVRNDSKLHETTWVKATVKIDESELHEDTDNTDIGAPKRRKTTPVPQVDQQSVNELDSLVRQNICKKLNLENVLSKDYRELAARFGIPHEDILTISQSPNPTDDVLVRIGHNPKNTIAQLREKLKAMGRDDCVEFIDSKNSCS